MKRGEIVNSLQGSWWQPLLVAALSSIFLLMCTGAFGQNQPQEQTPSNDPRRQGRGQPDPKRLAHLKVAMKGRLSPVIANRRAPQTEAAVIAALKQQKLAAQVQGSHTMGATPGQGNSQDPTGGQSTPPGGTGKGNQPAGGGTNPTGGSTPGASGGPSTPTGGSSNPPGGGTPSSGSNNPPSSVGPSRGAPLSARPATATAPVRVTPPPASPQPQPSGPNSKAVLHSSQLVQGCVVTSNQAGIVSVSGQEGGGAVFTQDPEFNPLTISGCHFGNGQGQVHLNDASGRKLADLNVTSWTDTLLKVEVDSRMVPSNDLQNVTLVVNPVNGAQGQKQGFKFHAMRKKMLLTSLPPTGSSVINQGGSVNHGPAALGLAMPQEVDGYAVGAQFSSPYRGIDYAIATEQQTTYGEVASYGNGNDGQGMTAGIDRDSAGHGYPGGTDTWQIKTLAPGFSIDSFQIKYWNVSFCTTGFPIADTQTHNSGSWNAALEGDTITVQFMAEYCEGNNGGHNGTNASYALNIWVIGPAGIDPITGQPTQ